MENKEGLTGLRNAVALCAVGAEKTASNEIKKLGMTIVDSGYGRVRFRTDTAGLYRALIGLRTADRILLEAGSFPAKNFDDLYKGTHTIRWEELVQARLGLKVVKVRCNRSQLMAETSIQSVVHKAAAQRLCAPPGGGGVGDLERLPETGAAAEVRVYIEKDIVSLLLDVTGDPLFKRGYRLEGGIAPLRETTAAALLLLAGWKMKYPLYDPFCGSGTILAEALVYAWDMAPGLGRDFSIGNLLIADNAIKEAVRNEFYSRINFERTIRIAGSDSDAASVTLAMSNLRRVGDIAERRRLQKNLQPDTASELPVLPEIQTLPMHKASSCWRNSNRQQDDERGFIVTNPPYGKRLGDPRESERIYGEMAALSRNFPGWKLAVITDHPGFESFFGRKADACREINNGPTPSYFYQYEML